MRMFQALLLVGTSAVVLQQQNVDAFSLPKAGRTANGAVLRMSDSGSFTDNFPNPFGVGKEKGSFTDNFPNPFGVGKEKSSASTTTRSSSSTASLQPAVVPEQFNVEEFDVSPEGLITLAKVVISTDLGLQNGSILSDGFLWIGPLLDNPLNKIDYLAAGKFFDLRSTFPDLDFRAHDYRIDEVDALTVRFTARAVGTMRGELRLRDQTLPPNGQQMRCPPETMSITFEERTGKVSKLCTGFTMDRLVGNTNGLCGVSAAATVAGEPPSDWEIYPALTVVKNFVGRPVARIGESSSFLAPFPETVMVQLTKGVLSANMAADDASLLGSSFSFMTPTLGPIGKKKFLAEFAAIEFESVEPELSHFRVDPYDPNRVWVDVRPLAPGYEGSPQAMSFSFDDDGFCTRITAGAVMDPSLGNAGGLGGPEGFKYATGEASPGIATRPLPRVISRLQKRALTPITGIEVDEYVLADTKVKVPRGQGQAQKPVETLSSLKATRVATQAAQPPAAPPALRVQTPVPPPTPKPAPSQQPQQEFERPRIAMPSPLTKPAPNAAAPKKGPTLTIPKMPSFSAPAPTQPKTAPAKKAAPKVQKLPTLSLPKMPSFSAPASTQPKKAPAQQRKAPVKKQTVAKQTPASKVQMRPSLTIPKMPSFSFLVPDQPKKAPEQSKKAPQVRKPQSNTQSGSAQKAAEQGKKDATTNKARELEQARLRRDAQAKEQAETRRQQADNAKELMKADKNAAAEAARERQEMVKREQARKQADQQQSKQRQEAAKQAAQEQAQERSAMQRSMQEERQSAEAEERRQADEARRQQEEQKQQASAKQKKIEAEQKSAAQAEVRRQQEGAKQAAAEQRKMENESKLAAQNEARRQAEGARKALADQKKQEAESKRAAEAQARQQQDQARKVEAEKQRKDSAAKKTASAKEVERKRIQAQKQRSAAAASAATKAKPGASIMLFGLGGGEPAAKAPVPKARPTLNLFGGGQPMSKAPQKKAAVAAATKAKSGASINLFGLGGGQPTSQAPQKKAAEAAATKAKPGATINLFGLGGGETTPKPAAKAPVPKARPTLNLFGGGQPTSKAPQKKAAEAAATKAKPGATINLFGLGGVEPATKPVTKAPVSKPRATINLFGFGGAPEEAKTSPKKAAAVKPAAAKSAPRPIAPRGVPSISGWKKNGDKSISGSISGSPNFSNGERVTTSPISQGEIASGKVVKTASGSRYFLI